MFVGVGVGAFNHTERICGGDCWWHNNLRGCENGNDAQEGVGTASDKAYKTVAAAVAAAKVAIPSDWVKATTHCTVFPARDTPRIKT